MSPGTLSGVISLVLLLLFVAGWFWVWSPKRRDVFEAAARLPLEDSEGDVK